MTGSRIHGTNPWPMEVGLDSFRGDPFQPNAGFQLFPACNDRQQKLIQKLKDGLAFRLGKWESLRVSDAFENTLYHLVHNRNLQISWHLRYSRGPGGTIYNSVAF